MTTSDAGSKSLRELRHADRFSINLEKIKIGVHLIFGQSKEPATLIDISMSGFRISCPNTKIIEKLGRFELEVTPQIALLDSHLVLHGEVRWFRKDMGLFGGRFLHLNENQSGKLHEFLKNLDLAKMIFKA